MQNTITLSQAAEELNIFYGDLLKLIERAHLRETCHSVPEDLISHAEIEVIKRDFSEYLPSERIVGGTGRFNPARWSHEKYIAGRYEAWFNDWRQKYRNDIGFQIITRKWSEVVTYGDFCSVIWAHCGNDRSEMNRIFSRGIVPELFEIYKGFKDTGMAYAFVGDGTVENIPAPSKLEDASEDTVKSGTKKVTKQWAYYYGLLERKGYFNLSAAETAEFFNEFGKVHKMDGHHIQQQYNLTRSSEGLHKQMRKRGAKAYVDLAVQMLVCDGFTDVAEFAQSEFVEATKPRARNEKK